MMHLFPKQLATDPWRNTQNFDLDRKMVRSGALEDGVLIFGKPGILKALPGRTAMTEEAVSAG
jgi:hypothetical protein